MLEGQTAGEKRVGGGRHGHHARLKRGYESTEQQCLVIGCDEALCTDSLYKMPERYESQRKRKKVSNLTKRNPEV
jgi:hypothetical protein